MVKVFTPHYSRMKGKIDDKEGRLGKVHFQKNRGHISLMFTMKRDRPATPAQAAQRDRFMAAALSYRDLPRSCREALAEWGRLRDDLISGYDWWTKAKLTDIDIEVLVDEAEDHAVDFMNADLQQGYGDFPGWTAATAGDGQVGLDFGVDSTLLSWRKEYQHSGMTARAMTRLSSQEFLVVGSAGKLLRRGPDGWHSLNTGTLRELRDVDAVDGSTAWAIADRGKLVKYVDGQCTPVDLDSDIEMYSVCAVSADTVLIGGGAKVLVYTAGGGCSELDAPTYYEVRAIWGTGEDNIWIGEMEGKIWHYDGSTWTQQLATWNVPGFWAMWGLSESSIYAVETPGKVWCYDGSSWTEIGDVGDGAIDLKITSADELYVIKTSGEVHRRLDGTWTRYGEAQPKSTYCFAVDDYGHVFRGGEGFYLARGTMYRHVELDGGSTADSSAAFENENAYHITVLEGATIRYGCRMKRLDADHPLPRVVLTMTDVDGGLHTHHFTPAASGDGWEQHSAQTAAPANLKEVKMGLEARLRDGYPDHALADGFFIEIEGRYLVLKVTHPLLERVMITDADESAVYYDSERGY